MYDSQIIQKFVIMVERELLGLIDLHLGDLGVVVRKYLEGVVGTRCTVVAGDVIDIGALCAGGLRADSDVAHEDVLHHGSRSCITSSNLDGADREVEAIELERCILFAEDEVLAGGVVVEAVALTSRSDGDAVVAVGVGLGFCLLLAVDAEHVFSKTEGDVLASGRSLGVFTART